MDDRYEVRQLTEQRLIDVCLRCGAFVMDRSVHDAWHAVIKLLVGC